MRLCISWLLLVLTGCTSLQPRPASSTLGCLESTRDQVVHSHDANTRDKRLHCLVSAQIALQCSLTEAYLAGMGKEVLDLFGHGDAEWADWQADRVGIHCGRSHDQATDIEACCAAAGY